jgi:NAD(P)-dependent dehydrogenase (short-subunit alcohol dehydrogenase family)
MIERLREANPKLIELTERMHPIGRFSSPDEIAKAIYWLASEEASFVVGTGLSIDGGYTSQ